MFYMSCHAGFVAIHYPVPYIFTFEEEKVQVRNHVLDPGGSLWTEPQTRQRKHHLCGPRFLLQVCAGGGGF